MSTQFQFLDKETKEPISLNTIDEAMCEYSEVEVKEDRYCFLFDTLTLAGVLILKTIGGSDITDEILTEWLNDPNNPERLEYEATYRKFLLDDYIFTAWYSHNF